MKIIGLCYEGGTRLFDPSRTNFFLGQNYPNPVYDKTSIPIGMLEKGSPSITISDIYGRVIEEIKIGEVFPGKYLIDFEVVNIPPGTYVYTLSVNGVKFNKLMTITE